MVDGPPRSGTGTVIPFPTQFSARDQETLQDTFEKRRTGIRFFDALHGFMSAILIGPEPIPQSTWLPVVWGHRKPPSPLEQRRIAAMQGPMLRFHESIAEALEGGAQAYRIPLDLFDDGDPETIEFAASVWCDGFYKGLRLDRPSWAWLKRHEPALLRPMWVFGTGPGIFYRVRSSFGRPRATQLWAPRLEPAVFAIRDFWRSPQGAAGARQAHRAR